jgi:enoyl-CoA hydratase
MAEGIIVKKSDDLLEITLNNPERGNGLSDEQIVFLGDTIEKEHENVRLIVLRANGEDFCTGRAGMGTRPATRPEALALRKMSDIVFRCYGAVRKSKAPVMTVVQGKAFGFGCALACVSDMTIAAEDASFSIPEFSHNIMPTMVMSSLVDRVLFKPLMYLVWTSKVISAHEAMRIGAVSDVVPKADLEKTTSALITRLMNAPRPAVLAVKEYAHGSMTIDTAKAVDFARNIHSLINSSSEMQVTKK